MPKTTGKDHAQINLDIWGDDDWLDLTPRAQHLYFVLWTSPQLSYCGTGEWHPGRIAAKAKGWTAEAVEAAAAELARELFLLIDTETGEFILRSWIKHDGLWKIPNMAVSMANARADLASRPLRGVIVWEVIKLRDRAPELSSWNRHAVSSMLSQKAVDPTSIPAFNPTHNPSVNPTSNPSAKGYPNPSPNPPANPGPTPTPAPTSYSKGGYVSGERNLATIPNTPPTRYCPNHMPDGTPEPCGACGTHRDALKAWTAERQAEENHARRQRIAEEAAARAHAIVNCDLCDDDGYRAGRVCDHVDYSDSAKAGREKVRAALASADHPSIQDEMDANA